MLVYVAAWIAGLSYWPAASLALPPAILICWKGSGVALLALWAASRAQRRDGGVLAAMLAFGAAGDVLLETAGLTVGALAFLAGHALAIWLYVRHPAARATWPWFALVPLVVAGAVALAPREAAPGIAIYSLGLGAMAAAAASSRFVLAGVGAWLFVASDLLIFARLGSLAGSAIPDLLVWPLYFIGQALIAWSVGNDLSRAGAARS